jgi:hypothetical protein
MNIPAKQIDCVIQAIANDILQDGIELYKVNESALFGLRGASGGIVSTYIFYLIKMKDDKTFYSYGVELVATDNIFSIKTLTDVIIKALANFTFQMTNESAKEVNLDGGDLGRASEKIHLTK